MKKKLDKSCERCGITFNPNIKGLDKRIFYIEEETKGGMILLCSNCYNTIKRRIEIIEMSLGEKLPLNIKKNIVKFFLGGV